MEITTHKVTQKSVVFTDFNKEKYMTLTAWANGEGYDVDFDGGKNFSLSHSECETLQVAIITFYNEEVTCK